MAGSQRSLRSLPPGCARPGSGPPLCTPRRDHPWHPWLRLRSPSREHPRQPLGPTSAFPESAHGVCRVNELCKQDPLPWLHWQTRRGPWSVLWGGGLLAGAPASCCPAWGAACHRTSRQSRWAGASRHAGCLSCQVLTGPLRSSSPFHRRGNRGTENNCWSWDSGLHRRTAHLNTDPFQTPAHLPGAGFHPVGSCDCPRPSLVPGSLLWEAALASKLGVCEPQPVLNVPGEPIF